MNVMINKRSVVGPSIGVPDQILGHSNKLLAKFVALQLGERFTFIYSKMAGDAPFAKGEHIAYPSATADYYHTFETLIDQTTTGAVETVYLGLQQVRRQHEVSL